MLPPSISRLFLTTQPANKPKFLLEKVHFSTTCSSSAGEFLSHLLKSKNGSGLEKSLNTVKTKLDAKCVNEVLEKCAIDDPHMGLRFFIWSGLYPSYRHSSYMYSRAYKLLGFDREPRIIEDFIEAYRLQNNYVPSAKMFKVILNLCRVGKDATLGLWVLKKMKESNCRPDTTVYNVVIRLLCEKGDIDEAMCLMREMDSSDLHPDMITYVVMIKGLSEVGRLGEACGLTKGMRGHGCVPNTVTYSALLDGICRFGSLERALELLREMEKDGGQCKPNVVTYTTVVQNFIEKGQSIEALSILDQMRDFGCKPNRVLICTLIHGLCKDGHMEEAHQVINRVAECGIPYDSCYSFLVLSLFRIGKLKEAEMCFRRMLAGGLKPDGLTSSTIMRWLCQQRRILDGYHLIDAIEQSAGISSIDSDIYSILMAGLCEENHLVEAAKLANLMVGKGIQLKGPCTKNVIECLRGCGKEDLASSIGSIKC
ncbi:PREDICTED: pentatricopeptide repeat-containing protein At5g47360-like [Nicotiana attenuata]|uniref:Pentatricopeptide repeat-containing protein n=1 Tax=Nicotiana attenuata TaxID=49451 RepID=A0A1J6IJD2_NICAT|nr:PREDICTED: pentatricopeptide repeat-containing protein At5g47360-like [Nicotiana attenuata]OIT04834.1 pentatricopeptide repeat-containing protein [Nicotiana attenuata]